MTSNEDLIKSVSAVHVIQLPGSKWNERTIDILCFLFFCFLLLLFLLFLLFLLLHRGGLFLDFLLLWSVFGPGNWKSHESTNSAIQKGLCNVPGV